MREQFRRDAERAKHLVKDIGNNKMALFHRCFYVNLGGCICE